MRPARPRGARRAPASRRRAGVRPARPSPRSRRVPWVVPPRRHGPRRRQVVRHGLDDRPLTGGIDGDTVGGGARRTPPPGRRRAARAMSSSAACRPDRPTRRLPRRARPAARPSPTGLPARRPRRGARARRHARAERARRRARRGPERSDAAVTTGPASSGRRRPAPASASTCRCCRRPRRPARCAWIEPPTQRIHVLEAVQEREHDGAVECGRGTMRSSARSEVVRLDRDDEQPDRLVRAAPTASRARPSCCPAVHRA